jgi:MFS superfamily sulfate permease-like transporter
MIAGALGGVPMTSVIVRSSANVYSGGRTRLSSFVHGVLLLVSVVVIPMILNLIPLAALAAILILVGYKLANAQLFKKMFKIGSDQFLPFIVTVVAVVGTDLLTGVLIGTAVGLMVVLRMNYHAAYTLVHEDNNYLIRFAKDVTFVQKMKLKRELARVPDGASILIDGGGAMFIDFDILEILNDFKASAEDRNLTIQVRNFRPSQFRLFPLTDAGGV